MRATPLSDHFDGRRFFNPNGAAPGSLFDVLRWKLTSRGEPWPRWVRNGEKQEPPSAVSGAEIRTTFINHSTLLLQVDGTNVLTDPVWSDRVSPVAWAGPIRHRPPGVALQDVPPIQLVLLSHNHYDHCDLKTLAALAARHEMSIIAPLGMGPLLSKRLRCQVHELDWWEQFEQGRLAVTCVPAQHFSGRGLFDRNRTLWCGYALQQGERYIYYAGDTGFGPHFRAIRERFGAPRLALLPVGAYQPDWFMRPIHMGPLEALQAHRLLGAATTIGIHHGTFRLSDEGMDDPARVMKQLMAEYGSTFDIHMLTNGQALSIC